MLLCGRHQRSGALLADDLQFSGRFHRFTSSAAYLDSLKHDPPEKSDYRVLSVMDDGDSVSVFYDYVKSEGAITVAQLCKFKDQNTSEILLVFDGRGHPVVLP